MTSHNCYKVKHNIALPEAKLVSLAISTILISSYQEPFNFICFHVLLISIILYLLYKLASVIF